MNDNSEYQASGADANETACAGAGNRVNARYLSHISIMIGIIVTAVGSAVGYIPVLQEVPINWLIFYLMLICVSWFLWASVWKEVVNRTNYERPIFFLFHKPHAMFWINIMATAIASASLSHIHGYIQN